MSLAVDVAPAVLWGFCDSTDWQRSLNGIAAYDAIDTAIGKRQSLTCPQLSWAWGVNTDGTPKYQQFYAPRLAADYAKGRLSVLTWMQMNGGTLADGKTSARKDPGQIALFNNESVLAGKHDAYLIQFGTDAGAYGHPFVIRLNPEMNGWWEGPFSEYDQTGKPSNGNTDGSFVRAWRYIVDKVRPLAPNILWHWCANPLSATGPTSVAKLPHFYPGDSYCDFVGYDIYNKAGVDNSTWLTFQQALEGKPGGWPVNSLAPMLAVAPGKPWMIGEMGCAAFAKAADTTPGAGDRPTWLRDMCAVIPARYPFIRSWQWYNREQFVLAAADFTALGTALGDNWPGAPLPDPTAAAYRLVATPDADAQIALLTAQNTGLQTTNATLIVQNAALTKGLAAANADLLTAVTALASSVATLTALHDALGTLGDFAALPQV